MGRRAAAVRQRPSGMDGAPDDHPGKTRSGPSGELIDLAQRGAPTTPRVDRRWKLAGGGDMLPPCERTLFPSNGDATAARSGKTSGFRSEVARPHAGSSRTLRAMARTRRRSGDARGGLALRNDAYGRCQVDAARDSSAGRGWSARMAQPRNGQPGWSENKAAERTQRASTELIESAPFRAVSGRVERVEEVVWSHVPLKNRFASK